MNKVMKASELPPGARMLPRNGRPLHGLEVRELVEALARKHGVAEGVIDSFGEWAGWQGWCKQHLIFPKFAVHFSKRGPEVLVELAGLNGPLKQWKWSAGGFGEGDWETVALGPFDAPDQFRLAAGLPRVAQFQLPSGDVVSVELPESRLAGGSAREQMLAREAEIQKEEAEARAAMVVEQRRKELEAELATPVQEVVMMTEQEAVGEPPSVPEAPPQEPAVKPQASLKKGVRK